jgi:ABC-type multidrug transport system fused ATPase/permease subunit
MSKNIFTLLYQIWKQLDLQRKKQILTLIIFSYIASMAEIVSLGALIPFITVLADPESLQSLIVRLSFQFDLGVHSTKTVQLTVTILFVATVIFSGLLRWLFLLFQARVAYNIGVDLNTKVYKSILSQSYSYHTLTNTSEILAAVSSKAESLTSKGVYPALSILNSFILFLGILTTILLINGTAVLKILLIISIFYILMALFSKRLLDSCGRDINKDQTLLLKNVQEGLGGIRELILSATQKIYIEEFKQLQKKLKKSQAKSIVITATPRYFIEAVGIVTLAIFAYSEVTASNNFSTMLTFFGVLILAAQRLLPIFQQGFSSWSLMKIGSANIEDALSIINLDKQGQPIRDESKVSLFAKDIILKNIKFKYPNRNEFVLNGINLKIQKGEKVGIVGATGSGKSTLLDIIMGLVPINSGDFLIDGTLIHDFKYHAWQKNIAHVPQSIYLSDATILENIAFGVQFKDIDIERAESASNKACANEFINSFPEKLLTIVGERGVQLSGGQRQRIAIARALYKNANVLIFDEATSALDDQTEKQIGESIMQLPHELTIIMVAHRFNSLKFCNRIIELKNGSIIFDGPYDNYKKAQL